jgi:hypothetical protein
MSEVKHCVRSKRYKFEGQEQLVLSIDFLREIKSVMYNALASTLPGCAQNIPAKCTYVV